MADNLPTTTMFNFAKRGLNDYVLSLQAQETNPTSSSEAASPITTPGDGDGSDDCSSGDDSSNENPEDDSSEEAASSDEEDDWSEHGGNGFNEAHITASWVDVPPVLEPPTSDAAVSTPATTTNPGWPLRETFWHNVKSLLERVRLSGSAEPPPGLSCCICYKQIAIVSEEGEALLVLPCGHYVGRTCWAALREARAGHLMCPLCEMQCAFDEGWAVVKGFGG